eukprot:6345254-Amphidinium_carterae.1
MNTRTSCSYGKQPTDAGGASGSIDKAHDHHFNPPNCHNWPASMVLLVCLIFFAQPESHSLSICGEGGHGRKHDGGWVVFIFLVVQKDVWKRFRGSSVALKEVNLYVLLKFQSRMRSCQSLAPQSLKATPENHS